MRINTNITSMTGLRHLGNATRGQERSSMKLSSGDRIFQAAEDPAGLAISEKMRAKVRSMQQSKRNSNDAISMIQVAEGQLETMQDLGSRLLELALRAATDTMGPNNRAITNKEYQALKYEIFRTSKSTDFNGKGLFNAETYEYQIGTGNKDHDKLVYEAKKIIDGIRNTGIDHTDISTKSGSYNSLRPIKDMIQSISAARVSLGAVQSRMVSVIENLDVYNYNLQASKSRIRDVDMAKETSVKAAASIRKQMSIAMLKNANNNPGKILKVIV